MDSSDQQTTNPTGSADIVNNSSMITPTKRDIFLSTYRRQRFPLPDSMLHYIAKNPKNAKVYQKTVKISKYFFIKNPNLIISNLFYGEDGWKTWVNGTWKNIDINRSLCKLWITYRIYISPENVNNNIITSSIIPKIYQCDAAYLLLKNQVISFHELILLCSSVIDLTLHQVTVKNNEDTVVAFEKLVEQIPKVKKFEFTFATLSNNISKNTFKELWKIIHLSNYDEFYLYNIPEDFDIESFYSFMKKNKKTRVDLRFSDELSEELKTRLEAIVDEIIGTKNRGYILPYIDFPGLDRKKYFALSRQT